MAKNALFLHFFREIFGHIKKKQYLCTRFREGRSVLTKNAAIAQLVEHHLAKVGVASSSLVCRSIEMSRTQFLLSFSKKVL